MRGGTTGYERRMVFQKSLEEANDEDLPETMRKQTALILYVPSKHPSIFPRVSSPRPDGPDPGDGDKSEESL